MVELVTQLLRWRYKRIPYLTLVKMVRYHYHCIQMSKKNEFCRNVGNSELNSHKR